MARALISLGSNLGDRALAMESAAELLAHSAGLRVMARSRTYQTRPIGGPAGQPEYLNAAALLESDLDPLATLEALHAVEQRLGRRRLARWEARPIDLDLLLYDDLVQCTPRLTVPHPRMAFRRFVIEPAAEIAGHWRHPTIGWTLAELREHVRSAPPYVAIAGVDPAPRARLATAIQQCTGGRLIHDPEEPRGDSTVLAMEERIGLLDRRGRLLDRAGWADRDLVTVSDFWLGQLRASPAAAADTVAVDEAWRAASATAMPPKLLILIEPADRGQPARNAAEARLREMGDSLAQWAARPGQGPLLRVPGDDFPRAIAEAVAAVEAMQ